jgi:hypothetical protein
MKIGGIIVGGMIFVLGLATALLSIHVAQLGTGATGWHLPAAIGNPIEALQAHERIHSLHAWLIYFGLGAMVVGLWSRSTWSAQPAPAPGRGMVRCSAWWCAARPPDSGWPIR